MPLSWIVHEIDGKRRIFIQEAGALIFARLRAGIAGFEGEFIEAHEGLEAGQDWPIKKRRRRWA
jgi:hypothetical protein